MLFAFAMLLFGTTCVIYTGHPRNDDRVVTGQGLTGRVYLRGSANFLTAELLAADSAGYLLLMPGDTGRVTHVPAARVLEVWFPVWTLRRVLPTTPEQFAGLREASRFPFGLPDSVLARVLSARGQDKVDTLGTTDETTDETTAFLTAARSATERYRSSEAARADGFKRVGTEFPFMGEHWVNLPRVLENRFDPAHPSVLIYITTPTGRALAGVGYSALLAHGDKPPASVAPESAWHEHNGAIVDESLPHGKANDGRDDGHNDGELRLSVLHAWTHVSNPAGAFVTDNEALPLARLGGVSRTLDAIALRGLTLAQDSAGYYAQTLRTALHAGDAEWSLLDRTVAEQHRLARRALAPPMSDAQLRAAWSSLWAGLEQAVPGRQSDLARIREKLER